MNHRMYHQPAQSDSTWILGTWLWIAWECQSGGAHDDLWQMMLARTLYRIGGFDVCGFCSGVATTVKVLTSYANTNAAPFLRAHHAMKYAIHYVTSQFSLIEEHAERRLCPRSSSFHSSPGEITGIGDGVLGDCEILAYAVVGKNSNAPRRSSSSLGYLDMWDGE